MEVYFFRAFFVICLFSVTNANYIVEEECLNYTVYPLQYDLIIYPYVNTIKSYYDCDLTISVIAHAPRVQVIELDAKELQINMIKVLDGNRNIINTAHPFEHNLITGKLLIFLKEPLQMYYDSNRKIYLIKISFGKIVKEDGEGVFLVKYYDERYRDYKYLFTTRLSPTKAKYFLPCFHNPRFEAVFKFKVYIFQNNTEGMQFTNTSLCIAPEQNKDVTKDQYIVIDYVPSPQVGLHQVGFHYSLFGNAEKQSAISKDRLVLWAPVDEIHEFNFIVIYGETIINKILEYSTMNRSLVEGPINLVAVPANIQGYEIGSWNLLTNGAHRLAFTDQYTSIRQILIMKFELAQQLSRIWLGNPGEIERTRWKEEWFKEGMATYLAHYFMTMYDNVEIRPRRAQMIEYGLKIRQKAMTVDWMRSTPALYSFNSSMAIEIPTRYKTLVEMKTAAILWMLENWVSSERFHQSLVHYIKSRRGKYITLQDYTDTLDRDTIECRNQYFNGSTSSRILASWLRRPGYPVINVEVLRDRTPNAVLLKQRQFSFTRENREPTDFLIPITYIVQYNKNCYNCYQPRFTIGAQEYTFGENLNNGWILLNRNGSGYYRVNYDEVTWRHIAKTLNESWWVIDEINRAVIVSDALALYVAGDLDIQLTMDILEYLNNENSPIVWESVLSGYELFTTEGAGCNITKHLFWEWEDFLSRKVSEVFRQVVSNEQPLPSRQHRATVLELACALNYKPCQEHVRTLFLEQRRGHHNFFRDCRMSYFYVLGNETFGNTYTRRINMLEQEDKNMAEHKLREKNKFLMRIPIGYPRPLPIIKTTTTEKPSKPVHEKLHGDSASTTTLSLFIAIISIIIILTT